MSELGELRRRKSRLILIGAPLADSRVARPQRVGARILPLYNPDIADAEVAELADAPALGAGGRKAVGVRVPSSACILFLHFRAFFNAVDARCEFLYTGFSVAVASGRTLLPFSYPDTEQAKGRIGNRFRRVSLCDTSI